MAPFPPRPGGDGGPTLLHTALTLLPLLLLLLLGGLRSAGGPSPAGQLFTRAAPPAVRLRTPPPAGHPRGGPFPSPPSVPNCPPPSSSSKLTLVRGLRRLSESPTGLRRQRSAQPGLQRPESESGGDAATFLPSLGHLFAGAALAAVGLTTARWASRPHGRPGTAFPEGPTARVRHPHSLQPHLPPKSSPEKPQPQPQLQDVPRRHAAAMLSLALLPAMPETAAASPGDEQRPTITDRVYFKVKLFRNPDGGAGAGQDAVYVARLVFGLYGEAAPQAVAKFRAYVRGEPPGFAQSSFFRLTRGSLLEGGRIVGLRLGEVSGSPAVLYTPSDLLGVASSSLTASRGYDIQVLAPSLAQPALDRTALPHDRRGLLTHAEDAVLPEFGITLAPTPELDSTHVVFGELLAGEEFLQQAERLPVLRELRGVIG
eukprot:EG_transcript_13710